MPISLIQRVTGDSLLEFEDVRFMLVTFSDMINLAVWVGVFFTLFAIIFIYILGKWNKKIVRAMEGVTSRQTSLELSDIARRADAAEARRDREKIWDEINVLKKTR